LWLTLTPAIAGEVRELVPADAKAPLVSPPAAPENPLSFYDGKLTFDFQERLRGEVRENNFDFNDSVDSLTDDAWLLQRARLGMRMAPVPWFSLYVQGQSSFELDSDRPNDPGRLGAEGDDPIDLRLGWIQFGEDKGASVKLGRQVLLYGDERLIGPLDWSNFSRTFDAAKVRYAAERWSLDLFTASVVTIDGDGFNRSDWIDPDSSRDQFFSGLYFSTTAVPAHTLDAYVLHLYENQSLGNTNFATLGFRVKADQAKLDGWEYDMEAAAQTGDVRGGDLASAAVHVGGGRTWRDASWKPRLYLDYAFATGDGDANDGDVGTFQNLFPTNHKFYGAMDLFAWQNLHQPGIAFQVTPVTGLTVKLDYALFWLADTADAWYRANGTTQVRPVTPGADPFAGSEIDLTVTWKAHARLSVSAGYSHFFAGDYLAASGANDDADFGFIMATLDF
jgi:hypothetical protein